MHIHNFKRITLIIVPVIVFLLHGLFFYESAGRDDVHITYAEALNFGSGNGLTNINGDRVEQSSSLLHVLILGMMKLIASAISVPTLGGALTIALGLMCITTIALLPEKERRTGFPAALVVSLCAPFVYWSFGGLEAVLAALIITAAFSAYLWKRSELLFSSVLSLYVLARPEAFFVVALFSLTCLTAYFLLNRWFHSTDKRLLDIASSSFTISGIVFVSVSIFRLFYFDRFFPLPVYAKSAGVSINTISEGLIYFLGNMRENIGLLILIILATFGSLRATVNRKPPESTAAIMAGAFILSTLAFIVVAGGDWMEGGRFFVPIIPLAALFGVMSLKKSSLHTFSVVIICICALMLWQAYSFKATKSTGLAKPNAHIESDYSWFESRNKVHLRDAIFIEKTSDVIAKITSDKNITVIYSSQAGMVLYHLKDKFKEKIRFVDIRALATDELIGCPDAANTPHTKYGLMYSFAEYFSSASALEKNCDMPRPDIIFNLGDMSIDENKTILANGFKVAYIQTGYVDGAPSPDVLLDQVLFVRNDLPTPHHLITEPRP